MCVIDYPTYVVLVIIINNTILVPRRETSVLYILGTHIGYKKSIPRESVLLIISPVVWYQWLSACNGWRVSEIIQTYNIFTNDNIIRPRTVLTDEFVRRSNEALVRQRHVFVYSYVTK